MCGILLLVLLVVVASRPPDAAVASPQAQIPPVILDSIFYFLVGLLIAEVAIMVWALWPSRGGRRPGRTRRGWLTRVLGLVATIVLLLWLRSHTPSRLPLQVTRPPTGIRRPPSLHGGNPLGVLSGADWPAAIIAGLVLVAVGFLVWRALRPPPRRPSRDRPPGSELASALDDALARAEDQADPRLAVIAAWARVERIFAERGAARKQAETPFEFAGRVAAVGGVEAGVLQRLADLYEWARFSLHQVTPDMRGEALRRLAEIRQGVHAAA